MSCKLARSVYFLKAKRGGWRDSHGGQLSLLEGTPELVSSLLPGLPPTPLETPPLQRVFSEVFNVYLWV